MGKIFFSLLMVACVSEINRSISSRDTVQGFTLTRVFYSQELEQDYPAEKKWIDSNKNNNTHKIKYFKTYEEQYKPDNISKKEVHLVQELNSPTEDPKGDILDVFRNIVIKKDNRSEKEHLAEETLTIFLIDRGFFILLDNFLQKTENDKLFYKKVLVDIKHSKKQNILLVYYKESDPKFKDFKDLMHKTSLKFGIFLNFFLDYKVNLFTVYGDKSSELYLEKRFFPEDNNIKSVSEIFQQNGKKIPDIDTLNKFIGNISDLIYDVKDEKTFKVQLNSSLL